MIKIVNLWRFAAFVLVVVAVALAAASGIFRLVWGSAELRRSGQFVLERGSAAGQVWQGLAEQGFTSRALPWRYYAWRAKAGGSLQAGTYQLSAGERVPQVLRRFTTGDTTPGELTVTYPEGFTLKQIAARTAARGIATEEEFMEAAWPDNYSSELSFLSRIPPGRDLEGYLFPDTYRFFEDDGPEEVIRRMLSNFNKKFSAELFREARSRGRTFDQIVIMAGIIEREVVSDEDMAMISGILWRRFDEGAGLDADATVRYALNKWDGPLTREDLRTDSPYNTRKYRGLPPGPISNPGLRAITAAVRPEESDYYYYLSTPEGKTIFSKTTAEHNANKAEYLR